jgi:hypothetical protein
MKTPFELIRTALNGALLPPAEEVAQADGAEAEG